MTIVTQFTVIMCRPQWDQCCTNTITPRPSCLWYWVIQYCFSGASPSSLGNFLTRCFECVAMRLYGMKILFQSVNASLLWVTYTHKLTHTCPLPEEHVHIYLYHSTLTAPHISCCYNSIINRLDDHTKRKPLFKAT